MEELFIVLKNRFNANKRLVDLGRVLYRHGDATNEIPPYVTVEYVQADADDGFDSEVGKWNVVFRVLCRGPLTKRVDDIGAELRRSFDNFARASVDVAITGMFRTGWKMGTKQEDAVVLHVGEMSFECFTQRPAYVVSAVG